jgi:hypothetical protein
MNKDFSTCQRNIADEIIGCVTVKITFINEKPDTHRDEKEIIDFISLYDQANDEKTEDFFISGLFKSKRISKKIYDELIALTKNNDEIVEDFIDKLIVCKQIFWKDSYNNFYDKFYNNL